MPPSLDLGGGSIVSAPLGILDLSAQTTAADCSGPLTIAIQKPAGTFATFARSDPSLCCPISEASCCTVAIDQPCIHAPTYSGSLGRAGVEAFGPGSNLLTYSNAFENAAWVKDSDPPPDAGVAQAVVADDASASCPLSPDGTTRMALITSPVDGYGIGQDAATGTARSIWLALATGDSACDVNLEDYSGDGTAAKMLSAPPVRHWNATAGQTGIRVERKTSGCVRWCQYWAQSTAHMRPQPYRDSGATDYAGEASTATTLTVPTVLTSPSLWAVGWRGTALDWSPGGVEQILWRIGNPEGGNSARLNNIGGSIQGFVYDVAANFKRYSYSPAFVNGSRHSITFSTGGDLYMDDALVDYYTAGAGVLPTAIGPTLHIGTGTGAYYTTFAGTIDRVVQAKTVKTLRRSLPQ